MSQAVHRRFPRGALLGSRSAGRLRDPSRPSTARVGGIGVTRVADTDAVADPRAALRRPRGWRRRRGRGRQQQDDRHAAARPGRLRPHRRCAALRANACVRHQDRHIPFRLTRWADGRLSVEDPTTGRRVDLGAFGAVNAASFAKLMTVEETTQ